MKPRWLFLLLALLPAAAVLAAPALRTPGKAIPIPGGEQGIGFDDIGYSPQLGKVLIPAGGTGNLVLMDPVNHALSVIPGVAAAQAAGQGHGEGTTSAVYAEGYLLASDHDPAEIVVVNRRSKTVVERIALQSGPDYVRYVESRHEVWVTEPEKEQIQVFSYHINAKPILTPETVIHIAGGPESLVIDNRRNRAYANLWKDKTVEMTLDSHRVLAEWPNTCEGSRGLALDETRDLLFVACAEGKAVTLSPAKNGKVLASASAGTGIDIISYSPRLHHLYVPGARAATFTIFDVASSGALSLLGTYKTAEHAHCVTDDNAGHVFVCDPRGGNIFAFRDSASR